MGAQSVKSRYVSARADACVAKIVLAAMKKKMSAQAGMICPVRVLQLSGESLCVLLNVFCLATLRVLTSR